jgi:hypothetical protein
MATLILRAYLAGYLFWLGAGLGCLAVSMIHALTGGAWALPIQGPLRAGRRTIPWLVPFFLPIVFGIRDIFPWATDSSAYGAHERAYYTYSFFILRAAVYFTIWVVYGIAFERASALRGRTAIAASGLIAYILTMTFASIDWVMSFTPHWRSTIYGLIAVTQQSLVAFAFALALALSRRRDDLEPKVGRDLGNLLLACVIFWTYLTFMQFLIVWSGNIPDEVNWYITRIHAPWSWIIGVIAVFQFALPFVSLLFRSVKRHRKSLIAVAVCILLIRSVDNLWWTVASYSSEAGPIVAAWTAWLILGAGWLALVARLEAKPEAQNG